jgi:sugar lactone lactonase YvrE
MTRYRFWSPVALAAAGLFLLAPHVFSQQPAAPGAQQQPSRYPFLNMDVVDPASKPLPNPNTTVVKNWGELPDGRKWGSTAGVDVDPTDGNIWAYDRCGANLCEESTVDPILKFDRKTGKLLKSFGGGMIEFPHGIHVDRQGNVWITDGRASKDGKKGHQVIKFSPDGKELMRIGKAGVAGTAPGELNMPNDVITNEKGEIFVSDGHEGQNANPPPGATGRIIKFTKEGKYVKEWGVIGTKAGEFRTPHALAFDSRGRLFVADRGNHRIQIFDQDGKLLDEWEQFSRVSGLFIKGDQLYAIDSESGPRNRLWRTGVRIGSTKEDKVTAFIPPHDNGQANGAAGEGVAVDADGNVYAAEGPISREVAGGGLTKYLR